MIACLGSEGIAGAQVKVAFTHTGYRWPWPGERLDPLRARDWRYYLPTPFGLLELCWSTRGLRGLHWCESAPVSTPSVTPFPAWLDRTVALLRRYWQGQPVQLDRVPLDEVSLRPFQRQVLRACRAIPYGETATYQDLARRIGRPAACRAVARALATNPWPIIIPCHRVVRRDGSLGGYSGPGGIALKQRLLEMERQALRKYYSTAI
jgi:O-6-methylguanine DNA methyltransferase